MSALRAALAAGVVVALAVASEVAGVRREAPPLSARAVQVDASSGEVRSIAVAAATLPNATGPLQFLVGTSASSDLWRRADPSPDANGDLRLVPGARVHLDLGEPIAIAAVDLASGSVRRGPVALPSSLGPVDLGSVTRLRNAQLVGGFDDEPPPGWRPIGAADFDRDPRAGSLAVALEAPASSTWNVAGIQQTVTTAAAATFALDLRGDAACDAAARHPRDLSGVTVSAADGTTVVYCVGSARLPVRMARPPGASERVVIVPGAPGAWVRVRVRPPPGASGPFEIFLGVKWNPPPTGLGVAERAAAARIGIRRLTPS